MKAEMSVAARYEQNAKPRKIMAKPEDARKARDRRRKVSTDRYAIIVSVDNRRVQKTTEDDALQGKEIL